MIKRVMMAGAFAGLLMLGGAGASSALPLAKPAVPNADVTKVAHAGPHGMGRGGMGRGGMGGYRGGNFRSRGGNFYGRPHGYGYGYGRGHFRNRGFMAMAASRIMPTTAHTVTLAAVAAG